MLLAQLSDIHAAPDNDNLSRLASALSWLDTLRPDVIVLTGDLVDDSWLAGYKSIVHLLDSKRWPTFILPGNADSHEMIDSAAAGSQKHSANSAVFAPSYFPRCSH